MISVVHITSRGLYPFIAEADRQLGQYDVLAQSLHEQSLKDFEVVCVDATNPLPRPELTWWLKDRVRFVRPRETPWTRLGAFTAAVARNTGLVAARGDVIVGLDDCYSFPPEFLERVAELAARGLYAVPIIREDDAAYQVAGPRPLGPLGADRVGCGLLVYPRALALACNGYDEVFERPGEDLDLVDRLQRAGVTFVRDPGVYVVAHRHELDRRPKQRCGTLVRHLTAQRGDTRGNVPWTAAELAVWRRCPHARPSSSADTAGVTFCGLKPITDSCELPWALPAAALPAALELITTYETRPWRDLAADKDQ